MRVTVPVWVWWYMAEPSDLGVRVPRATELSEQRHEIRVLRGIAEVHEHPSGRGPAELGHDLRQCVRRGGTIAAHVHQDVGALVSRRTGRVVLAEVLRIEKRVPVQPDDLVRALRLRRGVGVERAHEGWGEQRRAVA